jgi:LDH2 family malate/lactate/ureidoglycolate dehydrogenase
MTSDEPEKKTHVAAPVLEAFATAILEAVGLSRADAQTVAWALVEANLEGIDTHGVSRLALYARRVRTGLAAHRDKLN